MIVAIHSSEKVSLDTAGSMSACTVGGGMPKTIAQEFSEAAVLAHAYHPFAADCTLAAEYLLTLCFVIRQISNWVIALVGWVCLFVTSCVVPLCHDGVEKRR